MSRMLAEFDGPDALRQGLDAVREAGHRALDAFSPFPLEGLGAALDPKPSRIRVAMAVAGFGTALAAFALQWWSSVHGYPLNSGGRPLNSWPVFLLVPFEVGVLAAGIGGFVAFLAGCGLPRLNDPLFAVPGFERATQDRFFLLAEPDGSGDAAALRHLLEGTGALVVTAMRP